MFYELKSTAAILMSAIMYNVNGFASESNNHGDNRRETPQNGQENTNNTANPSDNNPVGILNIPPQFRNVVITRISNNVAKHTGNHTDTDTNTDTDTDTDTDHTDDHNDTRSADNVGNTNNGNANGNNEPLDQNRNESNSTDQRDENSDKIDNPQQGEDLLKSLKQKIESSIKQIQEIQNQGGNAEVINQLLTLEQLNEFHLISEQLNEFRLTPEQLRERNLISELSELITSIEKGDAQLGELIASLQPKSSNKGDFPSQ
jgi:hypothetical protein